MCGIAGIATRDDLRPDDPALVSAMLGTIAHRGPDDQQMHCAEQAIIGARRLSIIDLETGRQPLTNERGDVVVSLNGEIYNYVELRVELERRGHTLRTHGDTETIAHLYEDEGDAFVDRLRGMFAIALWDAARHRLVLVRDRLGKKPVYWRLTNGRLTWGSEIKAILADPDVPRSVDRLALARYLQYGYVPDPLSILSGISKLPPASMLTWEPGAEPQIVRYWTPEVAPRIVAPEQAREECLALLREAVGIRLRSDVPLGAFLSGGIDSSLVVALMAEASSRPVRTYSIGFEEEAFNELPHARRIATAFGTDHTEAVVRLDAVDALPRLARVYDEPLADTSTLPTFRVAQLASEGVTVVLTGDGGDETFGGYRTYRRQAAMETISRLTGRLHGPLAGLAGAVVPSIAGGSALRARLQRWQSDAGLDPDERFIGMMSMTTAPMRAALLGSADLVDQDGYLRSILATAPEWSVVARAEYADLMSYLPGDLLVKVDRATMANSLEARAPFLDQELVSFAMRLPASLKVHRTRTKSLLRDVAARLIPADLAARPKAGFSVPIDAWFRDGLGRLFESCVLAPDSLTRDHVDRATTARLLGEHRAGTADHGNILWALLMFEHWAREWLPGRPS
ncbi:MAG TPA: asparagine synthase (glutamine-hydrolyzing) [Candidatus Limnocylindrales bacterium]|nr:asparagine synthase (glutamine-hydrolyzing) [Candidatus Limnocylindrales bacterium]